MTATTMAWAQGTWTRTPAREVREGGALIVTAAEGSDFWRETSYGFVHDDGHGLLAPFPDRTAVEVSFLCDYDQQFDQAGVLVRADERSWTKVAVEYADGAPQLGAVVTRGASDWSLAPCPDWHGREVTVRVSRDGNALTARARCDGDWQLVRVSPLDEALDWYAGPMVNAPLNADLSVRLTAWRTGPADLALH